MGYIHIDSVVSSIRTASWRWGRIKEVLRTSNSPFYIAFRKVGVKELMTFKSNEKQYS